jgi:hypothetical protein
VLGPGRSLFSLLPVPSSPQVLILLGPGERSQPLRYDSRDCRHAWSGRVRVRVHHSDLLPGPREAHAPTSTLCLTLWFHSVSLSIQRTADRSYLWPLYEYTESYIGIKLARKRFYRVHAMHAEAVVFRRDARDGVPSEAAQDGDESEDDLLQRPALPVSGQPTNESTPPSDGLEYLRRVRKQANSLPTVVQARIEPEQMSHRDGRSLTARAAPATPRSNSMLAALNSAAASEPMPPPPPPLRPHFAWQQELLEEFIELRVELSHQRQRSHARSRYAATPFPEPTDAAGWAAFCLGTARRPKPKLAPQATESPEAPEPAEAKVEAVPEEPPRGAHVFPPSMGSLVAMISPAPAATCRAPSTAPTPPSPRSVSSVGWTQGARESAAHVPHADTPKGAASRAWGGGDAPPMPQLQSASEGSATDGEGKWTGGHAPTVALLVALDQRRAAGVLRGLLRALELDAGLADAAESDEVRAEAADGGADAAEEPASPMQHRARLAAMEARHAAWAAREGASSASKGLPNDAFGRWAYAAMARVDASLDADLCATIRSLYLNCIQLRAKLAERHGDGGGQLELLGDDAMRRVAALNIVITLCGGYFNQGPRDEWQGIVDEDQDV